ncbi:MAG: sulfatase [Bryobacterales bacterium]|nr:sulfatase [Bryobacterales bacterium]
MKRRDVLKSAAVVGAPAVLSQGRKRNLVFILCDDHRFDMMGFRGHPWLNTPGLDRLAQGGVVLENAFCTTALCSPSRASILTGQYAHTHGVIDNPYRLDPGALTFPRVLQGHGYRTAFIGKWHMGGGSDEPQPGFSHWVSFRGQGTYLDPEMNFNGQRRKVKGYMTDILTEEAARFVRNTTTEPFCLYLSHKGVHSEFIPADRYKHRYSDAPIPRPKSMANTEENYHGKPDWLRRARSSCLGVDGMYDRRVSFDNAYRGYCRTLMAVDESVGRMMDELESRSLLEDTLIVYMGDNGFLWGEHGLIDKRCMYEPSIRVPMIAHCPGLLGRGRRASGMALNIDICPTMLHAAGVPVPSTVHGRSLFDLLGGVGGWRKEFLYEYFWARNFPQIPAVTGLRTEQHSYMQYQGVWDVDELYDVGKDPDQQNNLLGGVRITTECTAKFNLIRDPELKVMVTDFNNRIRRIQEQTPSRGMWGLGERL